MLVISSDVICMGSFQSQLLASYGITIICNSVLIWTQKFRLQHEEADY